MKRIIFVFLFLFLNIAGKAQRFGAGWGFIFDYNVPTIGLEGRILYEPEPKWAFIFSLSQHADLLEDTLMEDAYRSIDVNYSFLKKVPQLYGIMNVNYNKRYVYYIPTEEEMYREGVTWEIGIGWNQHKNDCYKFYYELRYNYFWQEINIRYGVIIFSFRCKGSFDLEIDKIKKRRKGKKKKIKRRNCNILCPAYF